MSQVFSKQSRYRGVPDVTVVDARGRTVFAKDFRSSPDVIGSFAHTVDAGDRLDHLASRYYGRPLQFWRICDANPAPLSPLALLGQEAWVTTRFPVTVPAGDPPWSDALRDLTAAVGVDDVVVVEQITLERQRRSVGSDEVTVTAERISHALVVTYNMANLDATTVAALIGRSGLIVGPPTEEGQVGRTIVVPVAVGG